MAMLSVFALTSAIFFPAPTHAFVSPLQSNLLNKILGVTQDAAVVGLGQQAANLDIRIYAMNLIKGVLGFVGLILIIMIAYGGFLYMTAQGQEENLDKAKTIIRNAVIGTAIIMSAYGITLMLTRTLVKTLQQETLDQVQTCDTQGGNGSCCTEWNAYQNQVAHIPNYTHPSTIGAQDAEDRRRESALYDQWRTCFQRAAHSAGLPGNLFN